MPKIAWIGGQNLRPAEVAASHANLAVQPRSGLSEHNGACLL
jgi:hypothetical protein